ncbi:MAG: transposase [archaeon]|nr:transposase [archaeon]
MELWKVWFSCVIQLKCACSHSVTFCWMVLIICTMSMRGFDMVGVTSFVRCHYLKEKYYYALLRTFHSKAIKLDTLTKAWTGIVVKIFNNHILTINGRNVLIADGIKVPKEGRKMPAVKKLHQESICNSKPEYIMGHSCQVISVVVTALQSFFSLPLSGRIHEGLRFTNRSKKTLLEKLNHLIISITYQNPFYLVADSYFASKKIALPLIAQDNHLITRLRSNAVAYKKASNKKKKGPGRKKFYGKKIKLSKIFLRKKSFLKAQSPVYNEKGVNIEYQYKDLIWRPLGTFVRFVWVIHPKRGKVLLMSTDTLIDPVTIIKLYGLRFKIEVAFRQAVYTIGTFNYHFWMKGMKKIKKGSKDQFLHRESERYRKNVKRKMKAYNVHIQLGLIAQGIMQYLSIVKKDVVWSNFNSWMRTMKKHKCPSEHVVSITLASKLSEFLAFLKKENKWKKFIKDKIDFKRFPELNI